MFPCPLCDSRGCDACENGRMKITTCPKQLVDDETMELIGYIDLMTKHGTFPVAGGAVDQAAGFIQTCARYAALEARFREESRT